MGIEALLCERCRRAPMGRLTDWHREHPAPHVHLRLCDACATGPGAIFLYEVDFETGAWTDAPGALGLAKSCGLEAWRCAGRLYLVRPDAFAEAGASVPDTSGGGKEAASAPTA